MRRWRVEEYREYDRLLNARNTGVTFTTVGSKGEGLTSLFESAFDMLYVLNDVLCVEADINLDAIPDDIDVLRMDTRVYPGHCRKFHEGPGNNCREDICSALCDNGYGDILLSSGLFLDNRSTFYNKVISLFNEPAGPSIPLSFTLIAKDTVEALPCHCPSILRRWAARPRHWSSSVLVQKVVSLGAYVTPVGYKGSDYKHMEWRVCFNTGEAELVNNLNETQAKGYVIIRMILKDIMKPTNKQITSFVLKTSYYGKQKTPHRQSFMHACLLYWQHDALRELRTAIEKKQLCYYMIPERNFMATCVLENALQRKWVADITDMMDEGPSVILRLEKIRKAIVASPEQMSGVARKGWSWRCCSWSFSIDGVKVSMRMGSLILTGLSYCVLNATLLRFINEFIITAVLRLVCSMFLKDC